MNRFTEFLREKQFLQNVSANTLRWYRHALKWLPNENPTDTQLKQMVILMRQRGLKETGCNAAMRCDYESHDQLGFFRCLCKNPKMCQDYVTGGPGYWLSRRAVQWIVQGTIQHYAEDYTTGKILRARGVRPVGHPGFIPGYEKHFVNIDELPDNWVTGHAVKADDMRRLCG